MTIYESGKTGRSNATPIKIYWKLSQNISIKRNFLDGSGITPSYFPALMKWSLLVLPFISWHHFNDSNLPKPFWDIELQYKLDFAVQTRFCSFVVDASERSSLPMTFRLGVQHTNSLARIPVISRVRARVVWLLNQQYLPRREGNKKSLVSSLKGQLPFSHTYLDDIFIDS